MILIGYSARSGKEHRESAFEYLEADDDRRAEIFEQKGSRYTELARLPYFDAVRMTVIDPMHNMLLGMSLYVLDLSVLTLFKVL